MNVNVIHLVVEYWLEIIRLTWWNFASFHPKTSGAYYYIEVIHKKCDTKANSLSKNSKLVIQSLNLAGLLQLLYYKS